MSRTCRSMTNRRKSAPLGEVATESILAPFSPMVVAITPSAPGSLSSVTTIWVE